MYSPVFCLLIEFDFTKGNIYMVEKTTKSILCNIDPIIGCEYLVFFTDSMFAIAALLQAFRVPSYFMNEITLNFEK